MKIRLEDGRRGIAALSTVLIMCAIMVAIGVIGAIISVALLNSALSERLAGEALVAARTGAQDAIIRVIRYKSCSSSGCPHSYSLAVGINSAAIEISDAGGGIITIESVGTAANRHKKIEVSAAVDASTGEFNVRSFEEVPL